MDSYIFEGIIMSPRVVERNW